MPLFDELEGLLGAEAVAKLSPDLRGKLKLSDELMDYYDGTTSVQPTATSAAATQAAPLFDMKALETMMDSKFAQSDERVLALVNDTISKRGNELVSAASGNALKQADQLNRIYLKHKSDFDEDFDSVAFNKFAETKGPANFSSVEAAYEEFTQDRRVNKKIEDGVREGLKARASTQAVPGYTPPSAKSPIAIFKARGRTDQQGSAVSEAAAALQGLLNKSA